MTRQACAKWHQTNKYAAGEIGFFPETSFFFAAFRTLVVGGCGLLLPIILGSASLISPAVVRPFPLFPAPPAKPLMRCIRQVTKRGHGAKENLQGNKERKRSLLCDCSSSSQKNILPHRPSLAAIKIQCNLWAGAIPLLNY